MLHPPLSFSAGPVVGSVLYSAGGFGLPFYAIGSVATVVALILVALLPKVDGVGGGGQEEEEEEEEEEKVKLIGEWDGCLQKQLLPGAISLVNLSNCVKDELDNSAYSSLIKKNYQV